MEYLLALLTCDQVGQARKEIQIDRETIEKSINLALQSEQPIETVSKVLVCILNLNGTPKI